MDYEKLKKRDSSLDILRIIAVFTVLSVHFFLHNGFYSQTIEGTPMYVAVVMRTLFSVCVPLFMLLTGYLMSKKELSKKYYSGITKTLVVFVISTLACMIYKNIAQGDVFDLKSFILGTLDFTGSNYSWYIEMYIGLFLLTPFLNLAYGKLKNKKQKQVLLVTAVFLTIIPSLFNIFNFGSLDWWTNPTSSDEFQKLVPSWWQGFYPVAYYLRGVSALPWSGAGCRWAEVLPALRLRGLDNEESAGVLGEVLLLSLCGDPDDRTFCHDVGCEKSASCFVGEPLECCRPLLVCERGGAGSIGSEGSTGLVRCFSSS